MQVDPEHAHDRKGDGEHERNRERHDDARAPAQEDEADCEDNAQRLHKGALELVDSVLDHCRLISHLVDVRSLWHRTHELRRGRSYVLAESDDIGAFRHDYADAECGLAALPDHVIGRILKAAGDGGDVTEAEGAAVRFYRRF